MEYPVLDGMGKKVPHRISIKSEVTLLRTSEGQSLDLRLLSYFYLRARPGYAQILLLALCSGIINSWQFLRGPYVVLGIESMSVVWKASALPAELSQLSFLKNVVTVN